MESSPLKRLGVWLQHLYPQHLMSAMMYTVARLEWPAFKNRFITWFINRYQVDMSAAERPHVDDYRSFNDFFTRALQASARPVAPDPQTIIGPADGVISQIGRINGDTIIQAKRRHYSVSALLGHDSSAPHGYEDGAFATIYLSPRDYHRIHLPLDGALREMAYLPGRLFSVNQVTTENIDGLFAVNERVVMQFDTTVGTIAVVMVGAIFVGSIETVWHGEVTPARSRRLRRWSYQTSEHRFRKGDEIGRFNMGSTVIVLFPEKARVRWRENLRENSAMAMGEALGRFEKSA